MLFCGIKLTHDGSVALIDNDKLIFSYEYEKFNNNKRYSEIEDLDFIAKAIEMNGYKLEDIDHFVVDGWAGLDSSIIKTHSLLLLQC
jgi:carbamoyltransferase